MAGALLVLMAAQNILQLPPPPKADQRVPYGTDSNQFGDLRIPEGPGPHPVAIVIHGGFWRAAYDLEHIGYACEALRKAGIATWSLEYRRIGQPGGGWPGTFDDIAAGVGHLRKIATANKLDLARIIAMGHSAGGHLALWAASQKAVALRGAVSLAGVADLAEAWRLKLSNSVVADLMGGSPEERSAEYRKASPIELLPLGIQQILVHGTEDRNVPFSIATRYLDAAVARRDTIRLIRLEGAGHFELIDPRTTEWKTVEAAVADLLK